MSDEKPTNKISFFKKITDLHKPQETIYEIKLESVTDTVDDLIQKAKGCIKFE
jgi:hypothetical protein